VVCKCFLRRGGDLGVVFHNHIGALNFSIARYTILRIHGFEVRGVSFPDSRSRLIWRQLRKVPRL